jgi:hypothetical protein
LLALQKNRAGRENPIEQRRERRRNLLRLFCARQKQRGDLLCLFIMAGLLGQRSALAAPLRGFLTPLKPVSHAVDGMGGGLLSCIEVTAMTTPTTQTYNSSKIASHTKAIANATFSINSIAKVIEVFRAHATGEATLDTDGINKLANNGFIISQLSIAIEILAESIELRTYQINEILGIKETL